MDIVKCILIGGTEKNQEKYHSLLLVLRELFEPSASSLQVNIVKNKPHWSVSNLLRRLRMIARTHARTHMQTNTHVYVRKYVTIYSL